MKKFISALIGLLIIMSTTLISTNACGAGTHDDSSKTTDTTKVLKTDTIDSVQVIKDSLVGEVHSYIKSVAPRSKMTAENIIDHCLEYDFDITLLLSQGHLETHFGTTGRNVFGLYGKRYSHPDKAVPDYLKLMTEKFLIKRSTEDLLNTGFTWENNRKAKYASNPNYCAEIKRIRRDIINNTNIRELYETLRSLCES